MRLTIIAGARPNFIKIAPLVHQLIEAKNQHPSLTYRLVHTGQHFDHKMSETFFTQLNIPHPDVNLNCGGGTQAEQTAAIMIGFEKELQANPADLVIVVGDVTSTMACSIVAKKLNTRVAHIEAGIRSFDLSMPEEINRMVTDSITDYFFTTSEFANENLRRQGVREDQVFFVGNIMIDTLLANQHRFSEPEFYQALGLTTGSYYVVTLHRPANVDDPAKLHGLLETITQYAEGAPVIFPVHPRTRKVLEQHEYKTPENLHMVEPMGYLEFNFLIKSARAVITDSGGITEETTVMHVPCLTLRENTERPETCVLGTNELVGDNRQKLQEFLGQINRGAWKKGAIPPLWDGQTAGRIVTHLIQLPL